MPILLGLIFCSKFESRISYELIMMEFKSLLRQKNIRPPSLHLGLKKC